MEQVGIARRDFLKGVAAAALTAGVIGTSGARALAAPPGWSHSKDPILPQTLQPFPAVTGPYNEEFWSKVRQTFVIPDNYIHMNTGTTGSQPLFSLINLGVYNLYKSMDPRDWQTNLNNDFPDLFPLVSGSALTARQTAVAGQYGANADEIVLSYNTTDACNLIFAGTPWNPGDRIICTQWEHGALAGPIAWARDNFGVEVIIVDMPSNFTANITVDEVVAAFEAKLQNYDGHTKQYIATSEVFYKNGLRMPVKELCQLAQNPKYGAYTIIDSAHGWGMLPVNCHDYGADFIAGAGHKWLCGGPGTGIFYVRNQGGNLPPFNGGNFGAYGNLFTVPSNIYNNRTWKPASVIQNRGENNTPALYAMSDSAAYFGGIGVKEIYNRGVALGYRLKQKIAGRWPGSLWVEINNDPLGRFATALTAFNPFANKDLPGSYSAMSAAINGANGILNTLAAENPKIYIRSISWHDKASDPGDNRIALRASTHGVYNNREQIDYMFWRLVKAVEAAAHANGLKLLG